MGKVHVFNAGPCLLPQVAYDNAIEAIKDFKGTGVSVLSISHRTPGWDETMDECRALWHELLNIPSTHEVVFLGGGASLQFLYVAMNYLEKKAAYLETGVWAKKALKKHPAQSHMPSPAPPTGTTPTFQRDMRSPKTWTTSTSPPTTRSTAPRSRKTSLAPAR